MRSQAVKFARQRAAQFSTERVYWYSGMRSGRPARRAGAYIK